MSTSTASSGSGNPPKTRAEVQSPITIRSNTTINIAKSMTRNEKNDDKQAIYRQIYPFQQNERPTVLLDFNYWITHERIFPDDLISVIVSLLNGVQPVILSPFNDNYSNTTDVILLTINGLDAMSAQKCKYLQECSSVPLLSVASSVSNSSNAADGRQSSNNPNLFYYNDVRSIVQALIHPKVPPLSLDEISNLQEKVLFERHSLTFNVSFSGQQALDRINVDSNPLIL